MAAGITLLVVVLCLVDVEVQVVADSDGGRVTLRLVVVGGEGFVGGDRSGRRFGPAAALATVRRFRTVSAGNARLTRVVLTSIYI